MRLPSLSEELQAITQDYDYGIVPGSATIFVLDESEGVGRLDLTLLEGVMIVVEVTDAGYKVTSHSPLCNGPATLTATQTIMAHLNQPFESMENLLMTISPMFCQRFQEALYERLQSVHEQQQQQQQQQPQEQHEERNLETRQFPTNSSADDSFATSAPSFLNSTIPSTASNSSKDQANQDASSSMNNFDHWIH
ncbi:hypothetical protein VTP01DRAFT_388 [Rhizomucor pusillus]|uniref:uncharacterized protein n=1 Tax=Rhizomucor pusillus TaxID=4840 RepID=UPI0037443B4D